MYNLNEFLNEVKEMNEAKMTAKKAEKIANKLYHKHGYGVQVDIFNLSKISDPVEKALMDGKSEAEAEEIMKEMIKKYREN